MAWRGLTRPPWEAIHVHLPEPKVAPRGGRPRIEDRRWFEGLLWILWTGAPWSELPRRYGSPSTCWRRLKAWEETGVLLKLWRAFLALLNDQEKIRWDECFADGRFIPAKRRGPKSARPSGARAQHGWFWSMARVLRWEPTWRRRPRKRPERLIADRGDDSNPLRARLARRGIDPMIPARSNHKRAPHQDGRKLRRYRRRWIIERTCAWWGHFRRLVVRDERLITTSAGFFHMACALLTLRRVLK